MLGRSPSSDELIDRENKLAGGASLTSIRSAIATSQDAAKAIDAIYVQAFGHSADSDTLANAENNLANGQALTDQRAIAAHSSEALTIVSNLYADWGQGSPTAQQISDAEGNLYTLSLAYAAEAGQSQDQLATIAAGYVTPTGMHWIQQDIASLDNQTQANALIASALTTSYIDGADDNVAVMGVLGQGGLSFLSAAVDQATGLDAVAEQQSLGTPDPCDPASFKAQHVTPLANTTIGAANTNLDYKDGIKWYSQNVGVGLAQRLQQQGYPYENYVTEALGDGYQQTASSFPVFDQWNQSAWIAVSVKTLDTGASSYSNTPSRITTTMVKYAEKMLNYADQGFASNTTPFTQDDINKFQLQIAVPGTTTDAQWQAICQVYQQITTLFTKTTLATDNGSSTKPLSITINSVS
ncbi:hypothetical protein [Rhizosaccharibacter radicis]|uniref:CdiA toxin EC869-like domain-containing protein n=1 Tax=Rhizosaccharibacter radicis TaxID=2782605 RepID=A0ABT1VST4_9PROT|nr:hypothetical protein [Acetobacteraceae bacterium KSS12]